MHPDNNDKKKLHIFEIIKWVSVIGLVMISIIGNYLYRNYNVLMRSIIIFIIVNIAAYITLTTKLGKIIVLFWYKARDELRKVVWPTYREGLHITCIVIGVTIAMSLLLWGLDTILVYVISFGLRL